MKLENVVCVSCLLVTITLVEGLLKDVDTYKDFITSVHNLYRSNERAADMKQLQWDTTLQRRAEKWSENCYWDHQRDGLGENLAYFWSNGAGLTTFEVIVKSCQNWWKEVNDWEWSTDCGQACHYTQMVWGNTERIGCALSKCSSLRTPSGRTFNNADYFVCFYDPQGNFVGRYPYTLGEQCTQCGVGETCNGGLCSKPVIANAVANVNVEANVNLVANGNSVANVNSIANVNSVTNAISTNTGESYYDNLEAQQETSVTYTETVNDTNTMPNPNSQQSSAVWRVIYKWTH